MELDGIAIPDGYYALRNPNYPQATDFTNGVRLQPINDDLGLQAFFAPLSESHGTQTGLLKVRFALFEQTRWPSPPACEDWLEANRGALKFMGRNGGRVLTAVKQVETTLVDAFGPTPDSKDLALIKAYAVGDLPGHAYYVRREHLCNTVIDRAGERFTVGNLRQLKQSVVGKSVLEGHDYRTAPVGRYYRADTDKVDAVTHLMPAFFMVRDGAAAAIANIEGGVWRDKSVGFNYEAVQCDVCGGDYLSYETCPHIALEWYPADQLTRQGHPEELVRDGEQVMCSVNYGTGKVEALEGSFVWLGCQYDANVVKGYFPPSDIHGIKTAAVRGATTYSFPAGKGAGSAMERPDETKADLEADESKFTPPTEDLPRDRDSAWSWSWADDADAIVAEHGWAGLGNVCLFVVKDGDAWPEVKSAYSYPHGKMKGGTLTTFFRGCAAALQRCRGASTLPEGASRDAGERHLAAHYRQFDEEFPEASRGLSPFNDLSRDELDGYEPTYSEEFAPAPAAPDDEGADNPRGGDQVDAEKIAEFEQKVKAAEDERDAKGVELEGLKEAHAKAEADAARATEEVQAYKQPVIERLRWLAEQLGKQSELETIESLSEGFAKSDAETVHKLTKDWEAKYEDSLPPRRQSEPGEPAAPDAGAEPGTKGKEQPEPAEDVRFDYNARQSRV